MQYRTYQFNDGAKFYTTFALFEEALAASKHLANTGCLSNVLVPIEDYALFMQAHNLARARPMGTS